MLENQSYARHRQLAVKFIAFATGERFTNVYVFFSPRALGIFSIGHSLFLSFSLYFSVAGKFIKISLSFFHMLPTHEMFYEESSKVKSTKCDIFINSHDIAELESYETVFIRNFNLFSFCKNKLLKQSKTVQIAYCATKIVPMRPRGKGGEYMIS